MPNYINTVHCKLIGLCALHGEARARVYQEWNARFFEHESFWLDVNESDSAMDMVRAIRDLIIGQGITQIAGTTVVIAAFLDLTREVNCEQIRQINRVSELMENALGCQAPVTVEFGYLADAAFGDKKAMRQYARNAVEVNLSCGRLAPLFLVADMPLALPEDNQSWKAAAVMLDALRRDPNPAGEFQAHNEHGDVGFLRYGEYDEFKRNTLQGQLAGINRALSDAGDIELQRAVDEACEEIRSRIEANFIPDPSAQPLHPGLTVTGMINQALAAHGRYAPFEEAKASTLSALVLTARQLQDSIREYCRPRLQAAAQDLARYVQQAQVGIELEMNKSRMLSLLSPGTYYATDPMPPAFAYNANGYSQEIGMYLSTVRENALRRVIHDYRQALCDAYEASDRSLYEKKRSELTDTKGRIETRLGSVMDEDAFVNLAISGKPLPMSCFYPMLGGGSTLRWILCRNQQDAEMLDGRSHQSVYCIDEKYGGLKQIDNAPIKALQALLFDCDEYRLDDLL